MIGFIVSSVAVILAAWLGYVAGRMSGRAAALQCVAREYVPAGTSEVYSAADSRHPDAERRRLANVRRTIRDDPGHSMMCDCGECLRVFGG